MPDHTDVFTCSLSELVHMLPFEDIRIVRIYSLKTNHIEVNEISGIHNVITLLILTFKYL